MRLALLTPKSISSLYDNHSKKPTGREVLCRGRRGTRATMGTTVHCDLEQEVRSFRSDSCADLRTLDAPESGYSLPDKHFSKPIKSEVRWLALRGIC